MCRTTKRQFAQSILAYLAENPRAEDTVEGIVEWWLLDQRIRYELEGAREALVGLVGKGLVLERAGRDGRSRYRINAGRLRDIKRMLNPDRRRPSATRRNKRNH
jgi:hypothetical protein